ncbi:TspO/MBR family protein [Pelagibacterium limicola]|uniref:TspO/MBR family protein n=1 Tax=Pelagibacterium limicola TaxID=2791022 RepID=UPI0018AFBFB9|nr:TspO/MBR family protein [Pelagibacterium limicola]
MDGLELLMLAAFLSASFVAASAGVIFRPGTWYQRLDKPRWRPPDWLFAPVWTALYAMIAVSGWLVWREAGFVGASLPLGIFAVQLLLNAAWSPLFFGLHRMDLALVEIVMLWIAILLTIIVFQPISIVAAWLLAPYLAWVTFACGLNFSIWQRNAVRPVGPAQ